MSITVSFILSTLEIIQLSISQRMHKELLYIHTVEYHSAFKRNEALIHTMTWKNLRNSFLSKMSHVYIKD